MTPEPSGEPPDPWDQGRVRELAEGLKKKQIGLIERKDTVQVANDSVKSDEFKTYERYVREPTLRRLVLAGLELKRLENDELRLSEVHAIREDIARHYGTRGLHVAELAQAGVLSLLLGVTLSTTATIDEVRLRFETTLGEVDKYAAFIKDTDRPEVAAADIDMRILMGSPALFIVLGQGSATNPARRVAAILAEGLLGRGYGQTIQADQRRFVSIFKQ